MKELTIEITNQCSLNCLHCSTNAIKNGKIFFTTDQIKQIKQILDKFVDFDKIKISGGEPFQHPQISKILKTIKNRGKFIEVLSSGVYFEKEIPKKMLTSSKDLIDDIVFSIYGDKIIHNKILNKASKQIPENSGYPLRAQSWLLLTGLKI